MNMTMMNIYNLINFFILSSLLKSILCQEYTCNYTECIERYGHNWDWGQHPLGLTIAGCDDVCIPRNQVQNQQRTTEHLDDHENNVSNHGNNQLDESRNVICTADTCTQLYGIPTPTCGQPSTDTCRRLYDNPTQAPIPCGVPNIEPRLSRPLFSLIVGGMEARAHSWPWQIALLKPGHTVVSKYSHLCGGSVIGPQWALTAAHCQPRIGMFIVLGLHNYTKCELPCRRATITKVWIYPNYTDENHATPLHNDIALIMFSPPINQEETISPVCLPEPYQHPPAGTKCYTTGWGHTDPKRWSIPETLQQVEVPLIRDYECERAYPERTADSLQFYSTIMTCAGDLDDGGVDACYGDSGGPLVCKLPGELFY